MSEYGYISLNRYMLAHPKLSKMAVFLCRSITFTVYLFYPLFLVAVYLLSKKIPLRLVLVPFISLVAVSVLRMVLNLPRIYEKYDIAPLYNKKTKGESFPSRHTFAIFIISFTAYTASTPLAVTLFMLGVILAALRVIIGVHYVRDVLGGFLFAVISALIGYVVI